MQMSDEKSYLGILSHHCFREKKKILWLRPVTMHEAQ